MPEPVTDPLPLTVTESVVSAKGPNVAVTLCEPGMLIVQGFPAPLQAPLQPLNAYPPYGVAVSVTVCPAGKEALQEATVQLIPAGNESKEPPPLLVTNNE